MSPLDDLWLRIRYSSEFAWLPEVVRENPAWFLLGIVPLVFLVLFWRRSRADRSGRRLDREANRRLRQELADCRREGDFLGAGQRYEALGKNRAALDAYRRGGHGAERVDLLLRLERRRDAKAFAREAEVWGAFADLCEEDGELAEAGAAHERAGHPFAAARCYEKAGELLLAADGYRRSGMAGKAVELLMRSGTGGREEAEALDSALRAATQDDGGSHGPDLDAAIGRCAQLWLEAGEPGRAVCLASDTERWKIAAPIARDHLPASEETAELCTRAGDLLAAADILGTLGKTREEALSRAEFFDRQQRPEEAAHWYEVGEEWALAGERWAEAEEPEKAAEAKVRAGEFRQAADLFARAGNTTAQAECLRRAEAANPREQTEREPARDLSPPLDGLRNEERYVLGDELGRGGMGVVYRAEDLVLRRQVAYKSLPRDKVGDSQTGESLLAEARAVAQLSHPSIVQVYDAGRTAEGFFIVMELVEGNTFSELLKQGKLSISAVVKVGRQVCSALAHAHGRRIIHRDIKPSNLLWTGGRRVKLTDFGLARALDESLGQVLTRPAGTPFYMAPEQIRGEPVDPRTDIYSLGCVLFELLCNCSPFAGEGYSIFHHLNTQPCDPRDFRLDAPGPLADLVRHCLHKDPEERPASAAVVARELAAIESQLEENR